MGGTIVGRRLQSVVHHRDVDPEIAVAKRALRERVRRARATAWASPGPRGSVSMPEAFVAAALSAGMLDPQGRPGVVGPISLAAYLAMPGEPDPGLICGAVRAARGHVLLPRPLPEGRLEWVVDEGIHGVSAALVRVPVPLGPAVGAAAAVLLSADVHVVIVPALAVDECGHRLGQGGGYYDRLLAGLGSLRPADAPRPALVALVHDDEVLGAGEVPVDAFDQGIDAALTPSGLRWFERAASGG